MENFILLKNNYYLGVIKIIDRMELRVFDTDTNISWEYTYNPKMMTFYIVKFVLDIEYTKSLPTVDSVRIAGNASKLVDALMNNEIKGENIIHTPNGIASIKGLMIDSHGNIIKA